MVNKPEVIEKGWGKEIVIHNSSLYCGKLLCFNKGGKASNHFHLKKQETWYISKGSLKLKMINTETAEPRECILRPGDTITIEPGQPHQVEALEESIIFEISTQSFDTDNYRIEKGDSQK